MNSTAGHHEFIEPLLCANHRTKGTEIHNLIFALHVFITFPVRQDTYEIAGSQTARLHTGVRMAVFPRVTHSRKVAMPPVCQLTSVLYLINPDLGHGV